jgi:type 1 glutamine amidotransferase
MQSEVDVWLTGKTSAMQTVRLFLRVCFVVLVTAVFCDVTGADDVRQDERIKVLIVDGFSNHDWKQTTEIVHRLLEETGCFAVRVSTAPPTKQADGWDTWRPRFADHDVIVQNCNSLGNRPTWPREVEIDLERYVRDGGGLYILHSANNAFGHWKEYDRMIGLGWRGKGGGWAVVVDEAGRITRIPPGEGRGTHHGPRRDTVIRLAGNHPIHEGYPRRWKTPLLEVYKYARGPAENMTVLSYAYDADTKQNWPVEWVIKYGQGNVYNSTFGHVWSGDKNPVSMRCIGFQTTLVRAAQWLATGKVTWPVPDRFPSETEVLVRPE